MFIFSSESLNYTQAQSFCRKRNASLAHVISEERTEGLAKFMSQNHSSFVGLSNKEGIWKNDFGKWQFFYRLYLARQILREKESDKFAEYSELYFFPHRKYIIKFDTGESLSCFDYRAWGEGQPSHRGCVTLVNPPAKSSPPFWKVVPCYVSLPFICEISPLSQRSRKHKNRHHT